MTRDLKFLIQKVEGLYYPCSENKGADQLRGDREADLRLCFRIYKDPVFFMTWLILTQIGYEKQTPTFDTSRTFILSRTFCSTRAATKFRKSNQVWKVVGRFAYKSNRSL